ncbi:MAG: hypothetical protein HFI75_14605 [Lachnospiraceae bacterium]|nr:hypothetical protein [Lachnospiraceae bacterium]
MLQEKLKEPRVYMCAAFYIALILPFMKVVSKAGAGGASAEADLSMNGYSVLSGSILGILLLLVPAILIALELLPQVKIKMSLVYLAGALLGIILTIVVFLLSKGGAAAGADIAGDMAGAAGVKTDTKTSMQIGCWLQMLLYAAVAVFTLIKDFAVNKESIKEQGLKNVFTGVAGSVTKEFSDNVTMLQGGMSDIMTTPCPNCGNHVRKGKKFCISCGQKMPENGNEHTEKKAEERQAASPLAAMREKQVKKDSGQHAPVKTALSGLMTVREYIDSIQTITCETCGEQIPSKMKFCPGCGEAVVIKLFPEICSKCGGAIPKGKKFCPDCGQKAVAKELRTNCASCNAELMFGKGFCVECGAKVE